MITEKILLPYNFTRYDKKALDFILNTFTQRNNIHVTLFSAYTPIPEIEVRNAPIMEKIQSNMNHLSMKFREHENELQKIMQMLLEHGFHEENIHMIFKPRKKDVSTEIIQLAKRENYTMIVVNHKPGKATHFFTGNVFSKIINALRDTKICVVT